MDKGQILSLVEAAVRARLDADPDAEFTPADLLDEIAPIAGDDLTQDQVFDALKSLWGSGIEPKTIGRTGYWGAGWSSPPESREIGRDR